MLGSNGGRDNILLKETNRCNGAYATVGNWLAVGVKAEHLRDNTDTFGIC